MTELSSGPGVIAARQPGLTVTAREPFCWEHSLRFIRQFPATQHEQVIEGDALTKSWRVGEQTAVARIRPAGDGPSLAVELAATGDLTPAARAAVADRISFYLSADDDLAEFDRAAREDPGFAPVAARLRGYHQVKFPSPVEMIVWAILGQRIPMAVARKAKLRLMELLNGPVSAFGGIFLPFPSLEQLAALSELELAEAIRNERKARYLFGTIRELLGTEEAFLRHADYREVRETLLRLPGIGPWSAAFIMIRGLGRMEVLPRDAEILSAARRAYGRDISAAELDRISAPYAPRPGYWAHYLRAVG